MNVFALTCILAFFSPLFIGILIILKGRGKKDSVIFGLTCIASSIWALGAFKFSTTSSQDVALFWIKIAHVGVILTPTFFFHFVCQLTKSYKRIPIILVYLLAVFFLVLTFLYENFIYSRFAFNQFYFFFFNINKNPIYLIFYITFYWIILLSAFFVLIRFFNKSTGTKRNQIKYFIIGCIIAWVGPVEMYLSVFGIPIYPYSNILIGIYPLIFAYAILRYRLMDIHLVIKKTLIYSLAAGVLTSLFVVLVLAMTEFLSGLIGITSFTITVIAALVIAILFNPLRNRIQIFVDKVFYKKTYDFYATIRKVSHDLASMFDVNSIYSFVGDIILSTLGLKNIYLLSAVPNGEYEVVYYRSFEKEKDKEEKEQKEDESGENVLKIDGNSEMIKHLKTSDKIVILDELPAITEIIGQETINNITSNLIPFDGEAVMPVFVDNNLELLIVLGEKLSGDFFTDEDIKLLDTVAHQSSIAIKNAKLYTEKLSSDRLASIGMMSATFAHEIRNPLTSIKTFAQLIPEKYTDTEFRETFSKIVIDEIGRIDGLIEELLSFSSKEALPREQDLDIIALMDDSLENLKGRLELEKRNINVEKIYKKDKINISGDLKKLKQAFVNIVNNGCQAMDENGILKVNILSNDKFVDVIIADSGKGISPQELTKIFDPFYTTRPMGVGLGLAISKKIIEDHNGKIEVESKLSEGTTFTISLPIGKN